MTKRDKTERMPCPLCGTDQVQHEGACIRCGAVLTVRVPIFAASAPPYGWNFALKDGAAQPIKPVKKVWVVQSKAPDHSGGERTLVAVEETERAAHRAAIQDALINWVQGSWDEFTVREVKKLRRLIVAKRWKAACALWAETSDYELSVEKTELSESEEDTDLEGVNWP